MDSTSYRVWQILLRQWADGFPKLLTDEGAGADPIETFLSVETNVYFDDTLPPLKYDMAGVYVRDLGAMRYVADAADEEPMFSGIVDRESAKKVQRADEQTRTALQIVSGFAFVIVAITLLGLSTILFMRAKAKASEAGMLRVIGYSHQTLNRFRQIESVMLWLPSLFGIPGGFLVGSLISRWKYAGNLPEQTLGFAIPTSYLGLITLGTLLATIAIVGCTSRWWHRGDPVSL